MQTILHCTKPKTIQSKCTNEGISSDSFNRLEGTELHKSVNLKPQKQAIGAVLSILPLTCYEGSDF